MSVDKKDYDELLERRMAEQQERLAKRPAQHAKQARVMEQHLTGDATWDKFLSFVQPLLDDAMKAGQQMATDVFNPQLNHDGVTYARIMFAYTKGRIEALNEVMAMPKRLVEDAELAAAKATGHTTPTTDSVLVH